MGADKTATSDPSGTGDGFAGRLRGPGGLGAVALLLIVVAALVFMPLAAALILLWAWLSKTPWRQIGLAPPRRWIGGAVAGVALGVALKIAMKAAVMPLLGAPEIVHSGIHDSVATLAGAASLAAYAVYGAGFSEELVFRGYLFQRLGKVLGAGPLAAIATLAIATALFAAAHWQQGVFGVENAALTGLTLGVVYLMAGRTLWIPMIAHAAFDLTAVAMIYFGLEPTVAHLVF